MIRNKQTGQALVLVLLSLSVVLTLVLYILSRSITDVAVSSNQEASVRAFSAAEAGVERALVTSSNYKDVLIGNARYTTTVTKMAAGSKQYAFPSPLSSGDSATLWFVSHDASGNLSCSGATNPCFTGTDIQVCWGNPGASKSQATVPAIELSVYYNDFGMPVTIKIGRSAVDPNFIRGGLFWGTPDGGVTCQIGDQRYQYSKKVNFLTDLGIPSNTYTKPNGLLFAQIKMFYNDVPHAVGVILTGNNFPSQGTQIDSTGVAGGSNRRVVVYQGWPENPFASNTLITPFGISPD